jgi:hypothetical protein
MRRQQIEKPRERVFLCLSRPVYGGWIKATARRSVGGNELGENQNATLLAKFASQNRRKQLVRYFRFSISARQRSLRVRQPSLRVLPTWLRALQTSLSIGCQRFQSAILPSGPSDDPPARQSAVSPGRRAFETDNPGFPPADDTSYAPILSFSTQTTLPVPRSPFALFRRSFESGGRHFQFSDDASSPSDIPPARQPGFEPIRCHFGAPACCPEFLKKPDRVDPSLSLPRALRGARDCGKVSGTL